MNDRKPLEFSHVYEAYHARVLGYAARLLGPDEAEDVAQDVFVKISRSLGSLADRSKLTSWVYRVTLNAARDAIRKRSASPEGHVAGASTPPGDPPDEVDVASVVASTSRTPEEGAMRREMIACYLDYIDRLPAGYHEVYVLRELEDLSNEEIASRLSLPVGTVKMRLHRARGLLNEQLRRDCRLYCTARGELLAEPKGQPAELDLRLTVETPNGR